MIIRWETDHDYVLIHVHQDMFGDWIFSRAWGQIGTQFGGLEHRLAEDHDHAMLWLDDETTLLACRGFRKVMEVDEHSSHSKEAVLQLSLLDQA